MCNTDSTDSFGAPRQGGIGGALGQLRPSARGPTAPIAGPSGRASVRSPAQLTGLASLQRPPAARGPRNRAPRL